MIQDSKILIVDDNSPILESLQLFLGRHYKSVYGITSPNRLFAFLYEYDIDVILLDMNFASGRQTGNEGIYWLGEIKKKYPEMVVILITAFGDVELAVKGVKAGAFDFVLKPWDNKKLLATIGAASQYAKSQTALRNLKNKSQLVNSMASPETELIIGESEEMMKVFQLVKKVAPTEANVLILGENGTGKEVIAREIHKHSKREHDFFFSFDIAALSESLFESELFGHEKGAFTDAKEQKIGKIEAASGGTLFMDEIGNLPLNLQAKLLTALQNKEIYRLGSSKPVKVDFRLISATNKPVYNLVKEGVFREDLLYRINTVIIELPPLRNRRADILPLSESFMNYYCKKYDKRNMKLTASAVKKMESYSWPGNIRELRHAIEKAVILSSTGKITGDSFHFFEAWDIQPERETFNLSQLEKIAIQKAIKACNGNMSHAAEKLGISRNTLYAKIAKYEI